MNMNDYNYLVWLFNGKVTERKRIEFRLLNEVENLNISTENIICYFKNLFVSQEDKQPILYVFTEKNIFKIYTNENDNEKIEVKFCKKSDIKNINYLVDCPKNYILKFDFNNETQVLNSIKDTNDAGIKDYNDIITMLINYFIN